MSSIRLRESQEGVVSLLVTMVLMIVISLIALGFAQVARRNQGQELDQQLSAQAFYAAESGVNDTAHIIAAALASATPPSGSQLNRTTCTAGGYNGMYLPLNTSSALASVSGSSIAYTCVLVNGQGPIQSTIGSTAKIIPLNASSNIGSIKLTWSTQGTSATPTTRCPTSAVLPQAATFDNCGMGVLRVDLLPIDGMSNASADTLAKETLTFFAVPTRQGSGGTTSAINYQGPTSSTSSTANLVAAKCVNSTPNCAITISIPGAYQTHKEYEMRVSSEYEDSNLQVTATNGSGNPIPLTGAQVVIDATGRAQGVVRRVQVNLPIGLEPNQLSDYAIESTDSVCKRFVVMQGSAGNPTGGYYASEMAGLGINTADPIHDPLCQ